MYRFRSLDPVPPDTVCLQCGETGDVLRLRDTRQPGSKSETRESSLRSGNTKSCGCLHRETQIAFHKRQIEHHQRCLKELQEDEPIKFKKEGDTLMPYAVEHRGKLVDVPFDVLPQSSITGRFPNDVVLKMDESQFHVSFGRHAVWVQGNGPYAVLSYCDGTITISRWAKVEDAIGAKRTIDGSGCGGGCVKVHVIIHFDPENGAARERERAIDNYLEQQREGAQ